MSDTNDTINEKMNIIKGFFSKVWALLFSRTARTVVVMALFNGLDSIKELVPVTYQPWVTGTLAILALYFRANPRANL